MADPKDAAITKLVRKEFTRHAVDTTLADIRVMHGVVYVRGTLRSDGASRHADLREDVERIARNIRIRAGIRDVVLDVNYRG
jgi:osmotically-inducible protein OsmY